jgi:hypothetical protein
MQRRAVAYRRHHGVDKRRVVGPAAARLHEHDSRLADDGTVPREADANRDLIVIVRRAPAGRDPCRNALDAGDRRLRLAFILPRPRLSATASRPRSNVRHLTLPAPLFAAKASQIAVPAGFMLIPAAPTWAPGSIFSLATPSHPKRRPLRQHCLPRLLSP